MMSKIIISIIVKYDPVVKYNGILCKAVSMDPNLDVHSILFDYDYLYDYVHIKCIQCFTT